MGRAAPCRDGEETGTLENAGALEALRLDWGGAWDIGGGGTRWQAASRDGTGRRLTRASAAGPGQFQTWEARITEPAGETIVVRHTLRELLDRLGALLGEW